jgi:DNA-binding Lrp family transcriptional regulator
VDEGLIRRFGVVVRHHELGLEANAMCVWDVPDAEVSALGRRLAQEAAVTLCYRRSRVPPDWPYNLFCMIHGSAREEVLAARADSPSRLGLDRIRTRCCSAAGASSRPAHAISTPRTSPMSEAQPAADRPAVAAWPRSARPTTPTVA